MLVEFTNDTMIHPKETAIFGSDDGKGNLIEMKDQEVYKDDVFGLQTMDKLGLIEMRFIVGDHLQFTDADVTDIFVPFLINGV